MTHSVFASHLHSSILSTLLSILIIMLIPYFEHRISSCMQPYIQCPPNMVYRLDRRSRTSFHSCKEGFQGSLTDICSFPKLHPEHKRPNKQFNKLTFERPFQLKRSHWHTFEHTFYSPQRKYSGVDKLCNINFQVNMGSRAGRYLHIFFEFRPEQSTWCIRCSSQIAFYTCQECNRLICTEQRTYYYLDLNRAYQWGMDSHTTFHNQRQVVEHRNQHTYGYYSHLK
ncbi:Hypothetical_protein [Hexamita inflata]|uniref:Hypothetical_protein n=1 Tax=Hexamita inflata TaxID=28002 RepID=A0AA86PG60_9EUKA|nr:Hypothetical protein HINF_LOCUS22852 [Hexamita inflata]